MCIYVYIYMYIYDYAIMTGRYDEIRCDAALLRYATLLLYDARVNHTKSVLLLAFADNRCTR